MRIFISSVDGSGSGRTNRVTLSDCTNTSALMRQICKELGTSKTCAIIKLKCQPYNLRIVEDWPLHHYRIKSGSTFIVDYNQKFQCSEPTKSTFNKIQEGSEEFSDDQNNAKLSFISGKGQFDDSRYLQQCLNQLLQAINQQHLDEVSRILKQQPKVDDQKHLQTLINRKISFLLNQLGDCGKNSLHCAIQIGNTQIVSFLLIKGANPTILTIDEYSPLQLAVQRRSPDIMRLLLMQPKTDINQVTSQSTALHLAVLNENMECLLVLLQNGVDADTPNGTGKKAVDICGNQNMRKLLIKKAQLVKTVLPYITKGNIYKVSSFTYSLKKRILVLNPFKNQLTICHYTEVEEKYSLTNVLNVEPIRQRKWLMSDQIYYLRIRFRQDDNKLILGIKHEKMYKMWINNFGNSLTYVSNSIFNKQVLISQQMVEYLNDDRGQATLHRRKGQQSVKTSRMQMSIMDLKLQSQIEQPSDESKGENSASFSLIKTTNRDLNLSEEARLRQSDIVQGSVTDFKPKSSISSHKPQQCPEDSNLLLTPKQNRFRKKSEQPVQLLPQFKQQALQSAVKSFKEQVGQSVEPQSKEQMGIFARCQKQVLISFRDFRIIRLLGNGAFGKVYLARHRSSQSMYALKVLSKAHLIAKRQLKYAVGEVNILKKMDSPFIIRLHYAFQTPKNLYMALDNCNYGDLSQLVINKGKLEEETAKFIIAQLILALQYLHSHNILYRDMKPQNILIGKDGYIQLTDFGLSKQNNFSMSFCGSPAYLSPEMLQKKGVGFANDIYGVGCVLFQLTTGDPPYFDENLDVLYENIKTGKLLYPSHLSIEIKSLLSKLLERDASRRLGTKDVSQIKRHDFFKGFDWQQLALKALPVPSQMFANDQQADLYQPVSLQKKQTELLDEDYKQEKGGAQVLCRIKNFTFIRQRHENNIY